MNVAYAATLVSGALVPEVPGGPGVLPDGLMHAVGYGGQALLLLWLLWAPLSPLAATAVAAAGALGFGIATELLQLLQPARSAELGDILADALGVAIALSLGRAFLSIRRRSG